MGCTAAPGWRVNVAIGRQRTRAIPSLAHAGGIDSLGVSKLWITGYSPTPEHPRVEKTALGAELAKYFGTAVKGVIVIGGVAAAIYFWPVIAKAASGAKRRLSHE